MITHWRRRFDLPSLPFFYVLLAGGHSAPFREAQVLTLALQLTSPFTITLPSPFLSPSTHIAMALTVALPLTSPSPPITKVEGGSALPHTAFASALDLGATRSEELIPGHPPRKQEVSE